LSGVRCGYYLATNRMECLWARAFAGTTQRDPSVWTQPCHCCDDHSKPKGVPMSWQPSNDPVLGDAKSCDALDLTIVPRTRDLGDGFAVRRALPHGKRQMVGPF